MGTEISEKNAASMFRMVEYYLKEKIRNLSDRDMGVAPCNLIGEYRSFVLKG
jgi:hypothetical protein